MSFATPATTSEVSPLESFLMSSSVVLSERMYSLSSAMDQFLILSYMMSQQLSWMILVTSSSSYGTTGLFRMSLTSRFERTSFAAILSDTLLAARPAISSPDFFSLAFARTSFTEPNSYVVPPSSVLSLKVSHLHQLKINVLITIGTAMPFSIGLPISM